MLQSIGRDAGDAGQTTRCSMTIATHNDFDWVHEMASASLAINSKEEWALQLLQGQRTPSFSPEELQTHLALTHSAITLPYGMLLLCSFHKELRHEQIFPLVCLSKQ